MNKFEHILIFTAVITIACALASTHNPIAMIIGSGWLIYLAWVSLCQSVELQKLRDQVK